MSNVNVQNNLVDNLMQDELFRLASEKMLKQNEKIQESIDLILNTLTEKLKDENHDLDDAILSLTRSLMYFIKLIINDDKVFEEKIEKAKQVVYEKFVPVIMEIEDDSFINILLTIGTLFDVIYWRKTIYETTTEINANKVQE